MKKPANSMNAIDSISEQHRLYGISKSDTLSISLINISDMTQDSDRITGTFVFNFYIIAIKRGFNVKLKYGQNYYDFDEGVMAFLAPGQVLPSSRFCMTYLSQAGSYSFIRNS